MAVKLFVWHGCVMAREDLHFRLRIPHELKKRIEAFADLNGRSMTAEIVDRLQQSIDNQMQERVAEARLEQAQLDLAYQQGMNAAIRQGYQLAVQYVKRAEAGEKVSIGQFTEELNSLEPPAPKKD